MILRSAVSQLFLQGLAAREAPATIMTTCLIPCSRSRAPVLPCSLSPTRRLVSRLSLAIYSPSHPAPYQMTSRAKRSRLIQDEEEAGPSQPQTPPSRGGTRNSRKTNDDGPPSRQSRLSGSRRSSMRGGEEAEEQEEEAPEQEDEEDGESIATGTQKETAAEKAAGKLGNEELQRKIKDVVRLALSCEYRKTPIKRDDINKKVLHEHSKAFSVVFSAAQDRLRSIFGMELVELPAKEKKIAPGAKRTIKDSRHTATKSYVLRSILPEEHRDAKLVRWGEEGEELIGVCMVVLSLILVNGRVMSDAELHANLSRLQLLPGDPSRDVDRLLATLVRQAYLDRQRTDAAAATVIVATNKEREADFEYRWGPRAKVEVKEEDIVRFVTEIYGLNAPKDLPQQVKAAIGDAEKE